MKRIKFFSGIVVLMGATLIGCNKEEAVEKIPYGEIPDMIFRDYLLVHFDTDMDGFISVKEAQAVKEIDLSNKENVASLKGIEYFTSLERLNIRGVWRLEALDLSNNLMLEVLDCSSSDGPNGEWNLSVTKNTNLKELYCSNMQTKTLDLSKNTALEILFCNNNPFLETLDLSNNKRLRIFNCSYTPLNLNSFRFDEYQYLEEFYNVHPYRIAAIDLSISNLPLRVIQCNYVGNMNINNLPDLEHLSIGFQYEAIHALNLTKSTKLKSLSLTFINCDIDISNCTALEELTWTSLHPVDISNNRALKYLYYATPNILDISNNTALETVQFRSRQGTIPSFKNNTSLKNVWIDLKEGVKHDFSNNPLIENLVLTGYRYSTGDFSNEIDIDHCTNLVDLMISDCYIDTLDVRNMSKLKIVTIGNCDSLSVINASNLQHLESFKVMNNYKSNPIEADFSYCTKLQELSLPQIKSLNLTGCNSLGGWSNYPR